MLVIILGAIPYFVQKCELHNYIIAVFMLSFCKKIDPLLIKC